MDTHWNPSNAIYGDNPVKTSRAEDCKSFYPNLQAINQSTNLYVYCGNNAINRIDHTGEFWQELWEYYVQLLQQSGAYFAVAGAVSQLDTVAPGPADLASLALMAAGVIALAAYATITAPKHLYNSPRVDVRVETDVKTKEETIIAPPDTEIFIFRYGGFIGGVVDAEKFVPSERDTSSDRPGLSFSTVPRSGSAMTTIDALNATGIVYAIKDGMNHVSVLPIGGTMDDWKSQGASSIWTQAILSVITMCP